MTLWRGTEVSLQIHAVGSPLLTVTLIDLGAMGKFIDIDCVQSNNLHTQSLPQGIPIYNVDRTLIIQYKGHLERVTFHITSISWMTIILSQTWLMDHNPEINWCTGEVTMTHCSSLCRPKTTPKLSDWLSLGSAETQECPPKTKSC